MSEITSGSRRDGLFLYSFFRPNQLDVQWKGGLVKKIQKGSRQTTDLAKVILGWPNCHTPPVEDEALTLPWRKQAGGSTSVQHRLPVCQDRAMQQ